MDGWIILDKPSGITSAHAVAKVKRILKPAKIGHAGTLDPLASGILPLALGEATKTVAYMMDGAKAYGFTVRWGEQRDTDDIQGVITATSVKRPSIEEIKELLPKFTGRILQTPPDYSAIKVDGKRAYDSARKGDKLKLKAREVEVHSLVILNEVKDPHPLVGDSATTPQDDSQFLCHCGKGTYIRSLARDMGRRLGCYGTISVLRRLKVAGFTENHAISLDVMEKMVHKDDLSFLRPVETALDDILAWDISPDQAITLRRGQFLPQPSHIPDDTVILARCDGKPHALCTVSQGSVKPVRVFNL